MRRPRRRARAWPGTAAGTGGGAAGSGGVTSGAAAESDVMMSCSGNEGMFAGTARQTRGPMRGQTTAPSGTSRGDGRRQSRSYVALLGME